MSREEIISCIGTGCIEPILKLYEELTSTTYSERSEIKVSLRENGFSVSIIALSILTIESALNRARYIEKYKKGNLEFFKNKINNKDLYDKLIELYVIRDLIVHNHIWRIRFTYNEKYNETKIYQKLLDGYGDKRGKKGDWKYKKYVNKRTKKTKKLKLNVNPIKIGITDVKKVFMILDEIFKALDNKNKSYFPINNFHFKFNGKQMTFSEIVRKIDGGKT